MLRSLCAVLHALLRPVTPRCGAKREFCGRHRRAGNMGKPGFSCFASELGSPPAAVEKLDLEA